MEGTFISIPARNPGRPRPRVSPAVEIHSWGPLRSLVPVMNLGRLAAYGAENVLATDIAVSCLSTGLAATVQSLVRRSSRRCLDLSQWTFGQCQQIIVPLAVCVGTNIGSIRTLDHADIRSFAIN